MKDLPEAFSMYGAPFTVLKAATDLVKTQWKDGQGFVPFAFAYHVDSEGLLLTFSWVSAVGHKLTEFQSSTDVRRYHRGDLFSVGGWWGCGIIAGIRYYFGQRNVATV